MVNSFLVFSEKIKNILKYLKSTVECKPHLTPPKQWWFPTRTMPPNCARTICRSRSGCRRMRNWIDWNNNAYFVRKDSTEGNLSIANLNPNPNFDLCVYINYNCRFAQRAWIVRNYKVYS